MFKLRNVRVKTCKCRLTYFVNKSKKSIVMKKKIQLILIFGMLVYLGYSQKVVNEVFSEPKFKTSFVKRLMNENFYLVNKNFHWKSNYIKYFAVSKYFNTKNSYKTDLLTIGNDIFSISALSVYSFDLPVNINSSFFTNSSSSIIYYLPVGIKLPLLTGKYYNLSFNSDFYWALNSDKDSQKSADYYNTYYTSPNEDTKYNNVPQIIDFRLNLNLSPTNWLELSLFGGYRNQFTEWYGTEYGVIRYSNNITGSYYGLSLSITTLNKNNIGLDKWKKTKQLNTLSEYNSFLNIYPKSHYSKEVSMRKEYLYFKPTIAGNISDCESYLNVYKNGIYKNQVEDRIEQIYFKDAMKGEIKNCEKYILKYPNGKYKNQIEERIEQIFYEDAMKGTLENCERYIAKFLGGKYIKDVQERIDLLSFNYAMKGSIEDCNNYLNKFKTGKYINQINKRIETLNIEKISNEIKYYERAINGTIDDCNYYLETYNNGKYFDLITKKRIELIKQEKKNRKNIDF